MMTTLARSGDEGMPAAGASAYPHVRWAIAFTLLGLGLSIWMGACSDGVYHDDDLTHLQIARWAFEYPQYLLHDWGRPGFTVPYSVPAKLGWFVARVFSGLLTALTAWLAYRVAARMELKCAALAPLLVWIQPLTFTLSYTTLTETPLALYLILSIWLFQRRNFAWSAAIISLAVITRQEAGVLLGIWLIALLRRRQPATVWGWLAWAPLLHNVLCLAFMPETPMQRLLEPRPTDEYGNGGWLTMYARWAEAAGLGTLVLGVAGVSTLARRPGGRLVLAAAAAYFATHVVVYRFGLFASGGYARFLVPLGPLVALAATATVSRCADAGPDVAKRYLGAAIIAVVLLWVAGELEINALDNALTADDLAAARLGARGGAAALCGLLAIGVLIAAWGRRTWRHRVAPAFAGLLIALAVAQDIAAAFTPLPIPVCAPLRLSPRHVVHRAAAEEVRGRGLPANQIVTTSPWFDEFLGLRRAPFGPDNHTRLTRLRPGGVLLWDARLCDTPGNELHSDRILQMPFLTETWSMTGGPHYDRYRVAILEKR